MEGSSKMKIGILTFHSQQNYGGVLQCWALKKTLESLGHDVVVIDRWLNKQRKDLWGDAKHSGVWAWIKYCAKLLLGCTNFLPWIRTVRSFRFVKSLGLTSYHFVDWKDAPNDLGVDLLVVGSDQVWNDWGRGWAAPYLFEGYEGYLPKAISYAASFGMKSIPENRLDLYKRGLARFASISCRESEGVEICRGLGFNATHVVDPTLLADSSCWNKLIKSSRHHSSLITHTSSLRAQTRTLVCYFMSVNVAEALPYLESFATANNCRVEVLTDRPYLKPFPRSLKKLLSNYRNPYPHVKICSDYGPKEFVAAFADAIWTLTDSFHAVMFSSIFEKNLRFIKPQSEFRKTMFARIEEFVASCINGSVFVDSVEEALDFFAKGETVSYNRAAIDSRRTASLEWLKKAIG